MSTSGARVPCFFAAFSSNSRSSSNSSVSECTRTSQKHHSSNSNKSLRHFGSISRAAYRVKVRKPRAERNSKQMDRQFRLFIRINDPPFAFTRGPRSCLFSILDCPSAARHRWSRRYISTFLTRFAPTFLWM